MSDVTLDRIGQIAINVQDVERATAFYREVLGMRFLFSAPPGLAFFDCGGVRLMLSKADKPEFDHPASILYYTVADITAAHQTLTGRGVVFVGPPHIVHKAADYDLWMADFRDSEGNLLVLMSEARR